MVKMPDITIPNLGGGVNKGDPREHIPPVQAPDSLNMITVDGVPQTRTGYTEDAGTGLAGTPVLHATHYQDGITGVKRFWVFTGGGAFYKDALTDNWTDGDGGLTISAGIDEYFSTAEIISLDSLKNHMIVCQADTKPIGGTFTQVYHTEKATGGLRYLLGADGYSDNTSNYHNCKKVVAYSDHLFLLHVQEKHNNITYDLFQRVRWSDTAYFTAAWAWNPSGSQPTVTISQSDGIASAADPTVITATVALSLTTNELAGAAIYVAGTGVTDGYYTIASNTTTSITLEEDIRSAGGGPHGSLTLSLSYSGQSSTAGFQDLKSDYGAILTGEVLGTSLAIYMEEAIYACNATTSATAPFRFDMMMEVGLQSPRLLVVTPVGHFFVGRDDTIYHYTGGKNLTRIGKDIETEFFSDLHKGDNSGYLVRNRSFGIHFRDKHAVGFMIPTGTGSESTKNPDKMYVYFYRKRQWEIWSFADNFTGWGEYEQPADSTANSLPILGDNTATNGKLYHWDYSDTADDSNAIACRVETKDFIIDLKNEYRIASLYYEAKGNSSATVKIEVSLDSGASWSSETTTETVTTSWNSYRADFNVTGYQMRFRFSGSASADFKFYLGSINIDVSKSGEVK